MVGLAEIESAASVGGAAAKVTWLKAASLPKTPAGKLVIPEPTLTLVSAEAPSNAKGPTVTTESGISTDVNFVAP